MGQDQRIWLAARLLLAKWGDDATGVALQHAHEWTTRDDFAAASLWIDIAGAIGAISGGGAARAAVEPPLSEVLSGTVTRQVMKADRTRRRDVERLMTQTRRQRRRRA